VETLLEGEDPSIEGVLGRLVPFLSSIVLKRRKREGNPNRERKGIRDGYQRKTKEIFIVCEVLRRYSNGRHFDSRAPTRLRCFENCAYCTGYPHSQATA
jgi:hypothetical protein